MRSAMKKQKKTIGSQFYSQYNIEMWTGRGQSSFISVHNENYSEYALRHRDIPKRYILTFLKRDGHVRTHHLRIDPTFKTSRANALGNEKKNKKKQLAVNFIASII